jgi:exonuclease V
MLYHHLLSALLSPTFSFNMFWEKVQVDPSAQFSDEFLVQVGLGRERDGNVVLGYPACLDDLADLWRSTVHSLRVRGVSPTLEIVYRNQPKHNVSLGASRSSTSDDIARADQEARDLARAIAASMREQKQEWDPDLELAIAESLLDMTSSVGSVAALSSNEEAVGDTTSLRPAGGLLDRSDIPWYSHSSTTEGTQSGVVEKAPAVGAWNSNELGPPGLLSPIPPLPESPRIIGRKGFVFDEKAMNAYVQDVLGWWRGERPPRGVDVKHSPRCL